MSIGDLTTCGATTTDPNRRPGTLHPRMTNVDVNITAGKEHVGQPWIWRLCREFDVKVNIRKASIDTDYGWVQLELEGPVEEIQRSIAWLMTTGLHVESLQRAVGA
ncbi:MAG: L-aspartate semialdehyde sulfurtransferase ferredoxin [Fimbriimonadaceae bacterium]|nr:L-aspartate semialdehyde sulfurtransferase ferredoxin [Fimbriimonadaceae bacterium]